jgi:hypothetical protein
VRGGARKRLIYLSIYPSIHPSIHLSIHPSTFRLSRPVTRCVRCMAARQDYQEPAGEDEAEDASPAAPADAEAAADGRLPRRVWAVSPRELREALSSLDDDGVGFNASDMHDASEVLGEIFNCLHR